MLLYGVNVILTFKDGSSIYHHTHSVPRRRFRLHAVVNDVETHTNALFICIPAHIIYQPPLRLYISSEYNVYTPSFQFFLFCYVCPHFFASFPHSST